ncbi:hypothetical protein MKW98_030299 [Papaver atlanticum]|uniref:Uncharacterized protein n=1 Tax=Papaver atlanticum TaxID=357466 RepID=A0AAD4TJ73_9MAGN|nr:hypothetical protein MKW98_030299 [Papaver atlanticum]
MNQEDSFERELSSQLQGETSQNLAETRYKNCYIYKDPVFREVIRKKPRQQNAAVLKTWAAESTSETPVGGVHDVDNVDCRST